MSTVNEERARALAVAGDFGAEALELNRRLVAENAADTGSRTRLARCYLQAGRLDEAEAEYREVLRLDARNRIAAGGLEMVEQRRHPASVPAPRAARRGRAAAGVRRDRPTRAGEPASTALGPVLQVFAGFGGAEFTELAGSAGRDVQARFAPRVVDLVKRVNALASSVEIAGIREPGKRRLFREGRGDVHAGRAHWYVFNMGGRWEPQFNIGMYAGHETGSWLRVGMGFDLTEEGADPDRADLVRAARGHFRRFQDILASPRRSLFLGWMVKENGLVEYNHRGPRLDLREPSQAASLIAGSDPERTEWVFFGKWLSADQPDEAATLADPVNLVRTIDRVWCGLVPLWRAMWEG
jgi:hypothetical protein